ncbi:MAG: HAMP domain-containing protein [Planctomycetes bacterium]|nr:HAMP domain-containing protein [Planctomycetota bacterium]
MSERNEPVEASEGARASAGPRGGWWTRRGVAARACATWGWKRRVPIAATVLCAGLAAAWLWRATQLARIAADPRACASERAQAAAELLAARAAERTQPAHRLARRVARDPAVAEALAHPESAAARARLLEALRVLHAEASSPDVAVEVLTPGWVSVGRAGSVPELAAPLPTSTADASSVEACLHGAVYAYYVAVHPVAGLSGAGEGAAAGAGGSPGRVVAYVPLDTVFPLHRRFRRFPSPAEVVSEETGVPTRLLLEPAAREEPGERVDRRDRQERVGGGGAAHVEVRGPLGAGLTVAEASFPERASLEADVGARARRAFALFAALLVLGALAHCARRRLPRVGPASWQRLLALLAALVCVRYALLWIGFPARLHVSSLWQPIYYANGFLFGVAGSPGEALLTALFAGVAMAALARWAPPVSSPRAGRSTKLHWLRSGTVLVGVTAFLPLAAGACHAVLRSFVLDSTLSYLDLARVLPVGAELAMLAAAFLCVVVTLATWLRGFGALRAAVDGTCWARLGGTPLAAVAACLGLGGLFARGLPASGELSAWTLPWELVLFAVLAPPAYRLRPIPFLLATPLLAALAAFPPLEVELDREMRRDLEVNGRRAARGTASPASDLVERVVAAAAADPEVVAALSGANPNRAGSLALSLWASGLLAERGCDCALAVTTCSGGALSEFSIRMPRREEWDPSADKPAATEARLWERRLTRGAEGTEVFAGSAPVLAEGGEYLGQVVVGVGVPLGPGGGSALPEVGSIEEEEGRRRLPPVFRSEFLGEALAWSTNPTIPRGYQVPAEAKAGVEEGGGTAWVAELLGGEAYDSLYVALQGEGDRAGFAAFHLPGPTPFDRLLRFYHLFNIFIFFAGVLVVGWITLRVAGAALRGWAVDPAGGAGAPSQARSGAAGSAGEPPGESTLRRDWGSFEVRLIGFFLAVSLVPILCLAFLTRGLISDRLHAEGREEMERDLVLAGKLLGESEAASAVLAGLATGGPGPGRPEGVAGAEWCRGAARLLSRDLSFFADGRLVGSSSPELYATEFFSPFLDAASLQEAESRERPLFFRQETVGPWTYRIGYRPYRLGSAGARGLLVLPVLENRREADEAVGRSTTLIFGLYGTVLLLVWWSGQFLARRISRPIGLLVEGTRRVAAGELGVQVALPSGGEFAELGEAFNRMTSELAEGRERLARAEREGAWREMAKQIAHEIKNPLTPMKLNAQLLRQAWSDRSEDFGRILEDAVATIIREVDLLGRIATEFSHFAKLPERRPAPCDLNEVLRECAALFAGTGAGRVDASLELDAGLPTLLLDRDEMKRVFTNLVKNAIQAMPQGGRLALGSRVTPGAEVGGGAGDAGGAHVREAGGQRRPHDVEAWVSDTGVGIPDELKPRLFEPYFSTKAEGTGLGLAMCRKIVEEQGGRIAIESAAGKGTTVRVWLPA